MAATIQIFIIIIIIIIFIFLTSRLLQAAKKDLALKIF
jgi:preprotein translocase subunit YajC